MITSPFCAHIVEYVSPAKMPHFVTVCNL